MIEAPYIIRLNIQHYRDLLKGNDVPDDLRPQVTKLLADAEARLSLAEAEEFDHGCQAGRRAE